MGINYGTSTEWLSKSKTNSLNGLITTNLSLAYDVARPLSYPGYGTTITDLSSSNITATLTNGPYYNSDNMGSIVLAGGDDYISMPNWTLGSIWTAYFWVKITTAANNGLMSHYSGGPVGNGMYVNSANRLVYAYYDGQWNYATSNNLTVPNNTWVHIAYTCPGTTGTMKTYINGVLDYSFTPRISWGTYAIGSIGCIWGPTYCFNGNISMVLVYNGVEHTQAQVSQQFNVHRKRYGV